MLALLIMANDGRNWKTTGLDGNDTGDDQASTGAAQGEEQRMLPARPQNAVTHTTKVQFISQVAGGKNYLLKEGGTGADESSFDDFIPENETQKERKRRLNRVNERKKRARKIVKIETLTSKFHSLTNENQALRDENKSIRQKIEEIKKQMAPVGDGGEVLSSNISGPSTESFFSTEGSTPPASTTSSSNREILPTGTQQLVPDVHSMPASEPTAPLMDLSFLSREQRVLLLQQEYEKQIRIAMQLSAMNGASTTTAAAAAQPQPSALAAVAPSPQPPARAAAHPSPSIASLTWPLMQSSPASGNLADNTTVLMDSLIAQQELRLALEKITGGTRQNR
jgi:hypothetical protein